MARGRLPAISATLALIDGMETTAIKKVQTGCDDAIKEIKAGCDGLRAMLGPVPAAPPVFDPMDPRTRLGPKSPLTPRGAEVAYRLFDAGKTRWAVARAMGIAFNSADSRYSMWKQLGGVNRPQMP